MPKTKKGFWHFLKLKYQVKVKNECGLVEGSLEESEILKPLEFFHVFLSWQVARPKSPIMSQICATCYEVILQFFVGKHPRWS